MGTRSHRLCALTAIGVLGFGAAVMAQPLQAQSVSKGRALAQRNCAQCHAIEAKGESPLKGAPAFRDLDNLAEMDAIAAALRQGLLTQHPAMPVLRLTPREVSDLIAFLRDVQTRKLISNERGQAVQQGGRPMSPKGGLHSLAGC